MKENTAPPIRCDKCKYWEHLEDQEDSHVDDKQGRCKRYPPKLDLSEAQSWIEDHDSYSYLDYRFWNFPVTESREWCGEFSQAVE